MPTSSKIPAPGKPAPLISGIRIEGFRSIPKLTVELGRVTVLIGANGSGKSNVLEALAIVGAAAAGKLDHEFLRARGIRPVEHASAISRLADVPVERAHLAAGAPLGEWEVQTHLQADAAQQVLGGTADIGPSAAAAYDFLSRLRTDGGALSPEWGDRLQKTLLDARPPSLQDFLIFTPDYESLRSFADEGQILPLGVRGEGLFRHILDLSSRNRDIVDRISEHLRVLDWFDGFVIPSDLGPGEKRLAIRDRYVASGVTLDQQSSNEGFLFLLFVYTLLLSPDTPAFFAIDNADTSLNPRVCAQLMADVARLARERGKQVILTTHNPALLDGLDLSDDEQRLLVCERDLDGHTSCRRIAAPKDDRVRLSEAFLRGYLGGLPKSF